MPLSRCWALLHAYPKRVGDGLLGPIFLYKGPIVRYPSVWSTV